MKKDAAISFLRLASSGKSREAFAKYVAADFRHHNPYFRGDGHTLMVGMEENAAKFPSKVFEIQRALEDGDFVAVHSRMRPQPGAPEVALVHIFRFQNDRIVELWDIGQPIPDTSPNEFGMF